MKSLVNSNELTEEMDKLSFICSCAINCVQGGGSVLIPLSRLGIILQLLEQMSLFLESSCLKVLSFATYYIHINVKTRILLLFYHLNLPFTYVFLCLIRLLELKI